MNSEKKTFHGGDALLSAVLQEGCEYVFAIPGGEFLPFLDAVDRREQEIGDIHYIGTRHEQGGANMADGYARVSGKIGICCGTVGPGFIDLIPGVAPAFYDSVKMMVIHPQMDPKFDEHGRLQQNFDQLSLMKPIVKYQKSISDPNRIIWGAQKCFKALYSGRPRPVQFEVREDAFYAQVDDYGQKLPKPHQYRPTAQPAGNPILIEKAVELIKESKKPFIISGGGVTSSEGWNELQKLSLEYNIPVATTVMGIGTMSSNHPTFVGATLGNPAVMSAANESDLIIALGCRFSYTMGYGKPPVWGINAKVIQVDIDEQMIGKNRPIDVGILADCKVVLQQIYDMMQDKGIQKFSEDDWVGKLRTARNDAIKSDLRKMQTSRTPIHPFRLVHDITKFAAPDDIIVGDGGDIAVILTSKLDYVTPRAPRTYLQSIGFGHLGVGIPYAIGAKLAKPDARVFCVTGDGSFLFNVQELDTAVQYDIPIVVIIADNQCWGMIHNAQKRKFKRNFFCALKEKDYVAIAKGFGCYAERVDNPDDLIPSLQRAVDSNKPAVIQVPIKFIAPQNTKLLGVFRQIPF